MSYIANTTKPKWRIPRLRLNKYREPIKMICTKNNKKLQALGIYKGKVVNVEPDIFNMINFYDKGNKITRHIKLSKKQMRKFKEE